MHKEGQLAHHSPRAPKSECACGIQLVAGLRCSGSLTAFWVASYPKGVGSSRASIIGFSCVCVTFSLICGLVKELFIIGCVIGGVGCVLAGSGRSVFCGLAVAGVPLRPLSLLPLRVGSGVLVFRAGQLRGEL